MKGINFRRVFVVAGLTALVIVYAVVWIRMISSLSERTGTDFIHFYAAGIISKNPGAAHVYELELQQAIEQKQVGFQLVPGQVLPFNHVPYLIPILSVIVVENYVISFIRWTIFSLILYGIGIGILAWWFHRKEFTMQTIIIICAGTITFFPVFVSLLHGQDTALLFLGACLWFIGLLMERDDLTGIGLALVTIRPHIALLLAFPLFFKKKKAFGWFCLGAGILSIISVCILGVDGMKSFIDILLITAGGKWYGMNQSAMVNLIGLLLRIFPGIRTASVSVIGWIFNGFVLVGLCVLWGCSREIREKQIGVTMTLALFAAPHLHYHDLTLLVLPLIAVMFLLVRNGRLLIRNACLIPLGVSLMLLFSYLIPILQFNFPYLVMASIILLLWIQEKKQGKPNSLQSLKEISACKNLQDGKFRNLSVFLTSNT
jgi:hypothetical protein